MTQRDKKGSGLSSKAEAAFQKAAAKVIQRARQTGTPIVVWKEGHIEEMSSEQVKIDTVQGQHADVDR